MNLKDLLPEKFSKEIKADKEVIAVLLYGSCARGENGRDIDICLFLDKKYSNLQMSKKRVKYSSILPSKYDIHIFQQLPLYIRSTILKEGKVLLCKKEDKIYEIAIQTIKEFEMYKKIYYNYLKAIENDN